MKTLHLNLAGEPYRNYRPVYIVAAIMAVLSALLILVNATTAWRYMVDTKETRARIADLERQTAEEQGATRTVEESLRGVNIGAINAQAAFVNSKIKERAFSWSDLLDQLERVVPTQVRFLSLAPSLNKQGNISLTLSCVSKTPDGMLQFLNKLFADPHFRNPFPNGEAIQGDGTRAFTITTEYLPDGREVIR
ncbi:MAG TPA: hypothetical protein VHL58_04410 [Thermoanaerobaculia bacterium]|nr:hypothetical protein [Thermoanaerobaculia bacterium]